MAMKNQSNANFIFGDFEQEAEGERHVKVSKQQLQYSGRFNIRMKKQQEQANSIRPPPNLLESKLIIIQPAKSSSTEPEGEEIQIVQLPSAKKQSPEIVSHNMDNNQKEMIVYPYEESEEIQDEPQSSIRKLYKAMKREQNQMNQPQEEKRMESHERQGHFYEQQSSQEEEDYEGKTQVRSNSLRQLVLFKVPPSKLIKCFVKIASDSFFSLETVFHFYLVQQRRLLMTARKKNFRISSRYQIFGKEKGHVEKLAVVRSNYSRTEYKLSVLRKKVEDKQESTAFSSSIIKMTKVIEEEKEPVYVEDEKCYLCYESNFFGIAQQKVQVIRPRKTLSKTDRFSDIKSTYENCEYQRIEKFGNRLAERNHEGKLVLDFKDNRISESSKNMIVENEYGIACLLLGKRREDLFALDVMDPFNFIEGFFVAICNLDKKLFVR